MSEVREGYKMTELGEIPSEWDIKSLGEITEIKTGSTPSRSNKAFWDDGEIPWMSSGEVNKRIIYEVKEKITELGFQQSNTTLLPKGTIMMAMNGQGKTRGTVAYLEMETTCNQSLAGILPNDNFDSKYIFHYLESSYEKLRNINGEGRSGLNLNLIKSFDIALPTLEEQQKIASILSTVDEQIDETEQLIVKTKELKKGLMQQLLTKGIGHTEFKHTEVGEIPSEWEVVKLEDITLKIGDGIHSTPKYSEQGTIAFVNGNNIMNGKLYIPVDNKMIESMEYEKFNQYLKGNSILLSINGTIGKVGYYNNEKVLLGKSIAYINPSNKLYRSFLYYLLSTNLIQSYFIRELTGSTIKNLSLKTIRETLIPFPTLEEQQKIASILSTVDEQIEVYEEEKAKYEELKKGLMQQLLTGQIRVKI